MNTGHPLALDPDVRLQLWQKLSTEIERYLRLIPTAPVAPALDPAALRALLAPFDFAQPLAPAEALQFAVEGLWRHQVHTPHPRYFGLFNPAPTTMGVAADALVAAFNPQIAAWSHSPFAAEVERHLVLALAVKFGYDPASSDGVFTSGGAEANHTALLCALTHTFPEYAAGGARALPQPPTVYVSSLSHHSVVKAARLCGLGTDAVRVLPADSSLRLDPAAVAAAIRRDRAAGFRPLLLVSTLGATGTGTMDPIAALADLAAAERLWLHADAAWGGMAALVPELRPAIAGIERADSITFDAHKSLSVPMAAGMFLTRHPAILERTFRVGEDYMPRDAEFLRSPGQGPEGPRSGASTSGMAGEARQGPAPINDPFAHSMQWSRRFIGLKLFLSLAVAGWQGYEEVLRHQTEMGQELRRAAMAEGWQVVNDTPLPLVCLALRPGGDPPEVTAAIVRHAVASGKVWVSAAALPGPRAAVRCCITNFRTQPQDLAALLETLREARQAAAATAPA
ncbi:MAG: pyridoxal phosphate-dependent decarboxylase family protein [Terriglobales bacterium]